MGRSIIERLVLFHYDKGSRSQKVESKLLNHSRDTFIATTMPEERTFSLLAAHMRRYFEEAKAESKSIAAEILFGDTETLSDGKGSKGKGADI